MTALATTTLAAHQVERAGTANKWQYILSDSITFSQSTDYAIRIQKPEKTKVFEYAVKIVASKQVDTLYIENPEFTAAELFNLTLLCKNKDVSLVAIKVERQPRQNNVIKGPWKS